MLDFLIQTQPFSSTELVIRVAIAIVIGCAIGSERASKNRPAGLRTHVLVALGACTIALTECMFIHNMNSSTNAHITYNFGRMTAQVISGVGFLGAGTIFMHEHKISGLTTAASVWNVACLGIATGYGYYWMSLIGCGLVLIVLLVLQKIIPVNANKRVEVQYINRVETMNHLNDFFVQNHIQVINMDFHIENKSERQADDNNVYRNIYTLRLPAKLNYVNVINALASYSNIQVVRVTDT